MLLIFPLGGMILALSYVICGEALLSPLIYLHSSLAADFYDSIIISFEVAELSFHDNGFM